MEGIVNIEEKYFRDNTHQFAKKSNTKIIITFEDIPNKAIGFV